MRKTFLCLMGLMIGASSLAAAQIPDKVIEDSWDVAYLDGGKAGYVHTVVREVPGQQAKTYRTLTELRLTVKRFQDTITLRMENGTDETEDGKVTSVFMRQFLAKDQELVMTGTVEGDSLHVRIKGHLDKKLPWDDQVIGLYKQERMFREKKVKPSDQFTFLSYEPTATSIVTTRVIVKDFETVDLLGRKRSLLRVEAIPEKIKAENGELQLPSLVSWLDKDYRVVRSQFAIPALGNINLYRSSRQEAIGSGPSVARITDIGIKQLIPLNKRISRPYSTESVVYRITIKDDDNASTSFARDNRQEVKNARGNSFELYVRKISEPELVEDPAPAKEEYLKSCYFIKSDDSKVKELTKQAVGEENDPWEKAKRIERWVHDHMVNKNYTEAFATADHVARTLEGDCTEHAMLTAAMCRATDVPSKTALGLLYVNADKGPVMGFHMWTEVYVKGQWIPVDATLGQGFVGATHVKIADHSWYNVQSLTPLLPVLRVLGKIKMEILEVKATRSN